MSWIVQVDRIYQRRRMVRVSCPPQHLVALHRMAEEAGVRYEGRWPLKEHNRQYRLDFGGEPQEIDRLVGLIETRWRRSAASA